jgi:hypothetical protein
MFSNLCTSSFDSFYVHHNMQTPNIKTKHKLLTFKQITNYLSTNSIPNCIQDLSFFYTNIHISSFSKQGYPDLSVTNVTHITIMNSARVDIKIVPCCDLRNNV